VSEDIKVLSLEEVRARVKSRKEGVDVSKLPTFHHKALGGTVYYGSLPSGEMQNFNNVEQYYPTDHPVPALRGTKASTDALDERNRQKILLQFGAYLEGGTRLDAETVEDLLDDPLSGNDNLILSQLIRDTSFDTNESQPAPRSEIPGTVVGFTQYEAAFQDLLIKTGWLTHWVEYVTGDDTSTPEMKEAAIKLQKLQQAAPEWAKRLQSQKLVDALLQADPPR